MSEAFGRGNHDPRGRLIPPAEGSGTRPNLPPDRKAKGIIDDENGNRLPFWKLSSARSEFGVPHYMKIDIEGYDGICIAGLNNAIAPQYISIEMDHLRGASDLGQLADLGYKGFKIICQNNAWHQVTTGNSAFYRWGPNQSIIRRLTKLRTLGWELFTGRKFGASGP